MTLPLFNGVLELGLAAVAAVLFLSLTLAFEGGYLLGRRSIIKRSARSVEAAGISTLTAGMLGLLAFSLSLTISFAQNRHEARRGLVLAEANAIGTAWLRTKLIDGDDGPAIAAKIEDYAKARLDFTIAASDIDIPAAASRTNALQDDIWRIAQVVAHRSPNPVTTALVNALNDMFDDATSQRFAYQSGVPQELMVALYFGGLLSIGALFFIIKAIRERRPSLVALRLPVRTPGERSLPRDDTRHKPQMPGRSEVIVPSALAMRDLISIKEVDLLMRLPLLVFEPSPERNARRGAEYISAASFCADRAEQGEEEK